MGTYQSYSFNKVTFILLLYLIASKPCMNMTIIGFNLKGVSITYSSPTLRRVSVWPRGCQGDFHVLSRLLVTKTVTLYQGFFHQIRLEFILLYLNSKLFRKNEYSHLIWSVNLLEDNLGEKMAIYQHPCALCLQIQ